MAHYFRLLDSWDYTTQYTSRNTQLLIRFNQNSNRSYNTCIFWWVFLNKWILTYVLQSFRYKHVRFEKFKCYIYKLHSRISDADLSTLGGSLEKWVCEFYWFCRGWVISETWESDYYSGRTFPVLVKTNIFPEQWLIVQSVYVMYTSC
jgi:hypothetical protein